MCRLGLTDFFITDQYRHIFNNNIFIKCYDKRNYNHGRRVHMRAVRWHMDCTARHHGTRQLSRAKLPIALLEPTDIPSQNKQNIKGRQGRNISSTKITCSRTMIWSDKVRRFQFQKQTRGTVKKIHCHQYFIQVRYTVNVNGIDACENCADILVD